MPRSKIDEARDHVQAAQERAARIAAELAELRRTLGAYVSAPDGLAAQNDGRRRSEDPLAQEEDHLWAYSSLLLTSG